MSEPRSATASVASWVSEHRCFPPARSSTSATAGLRLRSVNSSWAPISLHRAPPAPAALSLSGTVSLPRSSAVSGPASSRSAVPVGKLDRTAGASQAVGPLRRERTIWVAGSTWLRTYTGSATAIDGPSAALPALFEAK